MIGWNDAYNIPWPLRPGLCFLASCCQKQHPERWEHAVVTLPASIMQPRAGGREHSCCCRVCCCCPLENPPGAVQDKWLSKSPWPGRGKAGDGGATGSNQILNLLTACTGQCQWSSLHTLTWVMKCCCQAGTAHRAQHSWVTALSLSTSQLLFLQPNNFILSCLHPTGCFFCCCCCCLFFFFLIFRPLDGHQERDGKRRGGRESVCVYVWVWESERERGG